MSIELETHCITDMFANKVHRQQDLIEPHILPTGGLLTLGNTNPDKASHFLFTWMLHMAAGREFLQFKPPYPLRILYVQKHYYGKEPSLLQQPFSPHLLEAACGNLLLLTSPKLYLDESGVELLINKIDTYFGRFSIDIIVLDPLVQLLDDYKSYSKPDLKSIRKMAFFLNRRLEVLRQSVNPDLGFILTHDVKEKTDNENKATSFYTFSPTSCIHELCTNALILNGEDNMTHTYKLYINNSNQRVIYSKPLRYLDGFWQQRT